MADNTPEVQAMIDALPRGNGCPQYTPGSGGIVELPGRKYTIETPLKLPSGVLVRGKYTGTVLEGPGDLVVLENPPDTNNGDYLVGCGLEYLTLVSDKGRGVSLGKNATQIQAKLKHLYMSCGGRGIDFEGGYSQNALIDDVYMWNLGRSALYLWGNANRISGINTETGWSQKVPFVADPGQLMVGGQGNYVGNCIIEGGGPDPCNASYYIFQPVGDYEGGCTMHNCWPENPTGRQTFVFDHTWVNIDRVGAFGPGAKIILRNNAYVDVGLLGDDGGWSRLQDMVEVDETSLLYIRASRGLADHGLADSQRIVIDRHYSNHWKRWADRNPKVRGSNLIYNAAMNGPDGWTVTSDPSVKFTVGTRLRADRKCRELVVKVTENPQGKQVNVTPRMNGTGNGTPIVLQYRATCSYGVPTIPWYLSYDVQFVGRAMGTRTVVPGSRPLKPDEGIVFHYGTKPGAGELTLSDVSLNTED